MYLDPGDLPGWITALIALGGVIYGSYNLRSLILDRRRQQADKIYFGLEFDRAGRPSTTIHVMNLSDAPITLVQLLFVDYPERTWSAQWNRSALMMKDDWTVELEAPETFPVVVGYVSFTDATNRTWYKLSNGKLYSFDSHPGALARWRFFPPDWLVHLRTVGLSPEAKAQWLRRYGFHGGLFRWGFRRL